MIKVEVCVRISDAIGNLHLRHGPEGPRGDAGLLPAGAGGAVRPDPRAGAGAAGAVELAVAHAGRPLRAERALPRLLPLRRGGVRLRPEYRPLPGAPFAARARRAAPP